MQSVKLVPSPPHVTAHIMTPTVLPVIDKTKLKEQPKAMQWLKSSSDT